MGERRKTEMEEEKKEGRREERKSGILKKAWIYWVLGGQRPEGEVS